MSETPITTRMIEANGLTFETDICGSGDKFALLLHGFPESKHSWRFQMPLLAELGYTVWAPNLRGYGHSSRPPKVADYNITHLIADVAGLIDAARAQGITGPITLMTHDWGGAIGWSFVLTEARPLERFVVMNLPHPTQFMNNVSGWAQLKKSWYIFFFQIPWLPEKLMTLRGAQAIGDAFSNMAIDQTNFGPEVLEHYKQNALIPGAMKAMINYYRASFRSNPLKDVWENPPNVKTPTLMVWGEEDAALGKELTYGTEDLVEDFTLRYLPNVSHWVQQEAPETVNAMLEAWLTDRPVPEASEVSRS
ncbi:MAG: alpha/beta hydrolase [Rhodobiaceae bacterium]|nr:alpha/beta hydrolase [Rhodobiaceae bacterium]